MGLSAEGKKAELTERKSRGERERAMLACSLMGTPCSGLVPGSTRLNPMTHSMNPSVLATAGAAHCRLMDSAG